MANIFEIHQQTINTAKKAAAEKAAAEKALEVSIMEKITDRINDPEGFNDVRIIEEKNWDYLFTAIAPKTKVFGIAIESNVFNDTELNKLKFSNLEIVKTISKNCGRKAAIIVEEDFYGNIEIFVVFEG